jgi:hypothetical protein
VQGGGMDTAGDTGGNQTGAGDQSGQGEKVAAFHGEEGMGELYFKGWDNRWVTGQIYSKSSDGGTQSGKQDIALLPGLLDRGGFEGATHAAFAALGGVQREMAPPGAIVVPKVVVGVGGVGAQGQADAGGAGEGGSHEVPGVEVANRAHQEQLRTGSLLGQPRWDRFRLHRGD